MLMMKSKFMVLAFLIPAFGLVAGCGGSNEPFSGLVPEPTAEPGPEPTPEPEPEPTAEPGDPSCEGVEYESTYAGIQDHVFERNGCTAAACHGNAMAGGLDLREGVSWDNLFEADATSSNLFRVHPGSRLRSELWRRLDATNDDTIEIAGSPMPVGLPPLDADPMELVRLWILAGAPEEGTVLGTEDLIDGCLPDPEPIEIKPLEAPAAGVGLQFEMPSWILPAASENEICFAVWYDFTDQVPMEFRSGDGNFFLYDQYEIRQDSHSHHLLMQVPTGSWSGTLVEPDVLEGWTCSVGSANAGASCDAKDPDACDGGYCHSKIEETSGCNGYGPGGSATPTTFSGTQQANFIRTNYPGVYSVVPIKGLIYFNSHAFNLTATDATMHARANFRFATQRDYPMRVHGDPIFGIPRLIAEGAAPYTTKWMCDSFVLPKGAYLTGLSSHTHKHGKHWWYDLPNGERVYDSYTYNDPLQKYFDPPIVFDQDDSEERRISWCALYNNGVDEDGNDDPSQVTRASKIQYGIRGFGLGGSFGRCEPTRCLNVGRTHIACNDGVGNFRGDDAKCDSTPGAGDGICDACSITGGVTTENEMHGPSIAYFVP
jgi:hypothetical protein